MLSLIHLDGLFPCGFVSVAAADIMRKRLAICVKEGLATGFGAQHSSISVFHSRSQWLGMAGRNVLFTIPPIIPP